MPPKTVEIEKTFYSNPQYGLFPFLLSDLWSGPSRKIVKKNLQKYGGLYRRKILNHPNAQGRIRIFLCGKYIADPAFDVRTKLQKIINSRLGCEAFLGENIDRSKPRPIESNDLLTIEVDEADRADLIILFLESPGTASELTAFALDKDLIKKLVVLNDEKYKDVESFLRDGPIELVRKKHPDRVIYFNPRTLTQGIPIHAMYAIDKVIAHKWFDKLNISITDLQFTKLEFASVVSLLLVYVFFPLNVSDLQRLLSNYYSSEKIAKSVGSLKKSRFISIHQDIIYPSKPARKLGLPSEIITNLARVRAQLLGQLMRDQSYRSRLSALQSSAGKLF